ncbi:MAG: PTS sugar transporter subunit IIB [Turicibacter sp.]|nr:PTS sugar transporter subunit IIB [Turicibacter sp.]
MKIKLFCAAGMSTSMLVNKMQKAAEDKGLDIEIAAFPEATIEKESEDCDVALLGPQVRYMLERAKEICTPKGIPVSAINMQDYGLMNGEKVLNEALQMYEDFKK